MAWWDSLMNYGSNNPMEALSMGVGAAGTGMGIYDMIRANQEAADQRKRFESLYRMGPESFMPRQTSAQMASFLKPFQADLAMRGIDPSSGAGQAAMAQALVQNYQQMFQQGANTYGQKLGVLGGMQPPQAGGDVGAFGKSLAYAMMARAAAQRNQQQPGMAGTSGAPGISDFANYGTGPDASLGNESMWTGAPRNYSNRG